MLGRKERGQPELFITGSLRGLIPDGHVLVRADQVLDPGWLRAEVADLYCAGNGRPGIDPEVAVRLMLAGFLLGIVQDRRLMRVRASPPSVRGDARKRSISRSAGSSVTPCTRPCRITPR